MVEYEISWWKTVWHDDCSYLWLYIFPVQFGELLIEAYLSRAAVCLDKEMFIRACKESHSHNKAGLTEDFIEAVKVEERCQGLEEFFNLYRGIIVSSLLPLPHWASHLERTETNILKAKVGWNKDRIEDKRETGKFC